MRVYSHRLKNNPTQRVSDMSSIAEQIIKPKLGLLELSQQLGNVSQACKVMGYSRDTFYRFIAIYKL
jgi:transcriptional regulator of acetoin/glycerol metabolism